MPFDVDLLVEVFVPTSADGKRGEVATGYPVAPGLVLTTGHVFRHHKKSQDISVRWLGRRNLCVEQGENPDTAWIDAAAEACLCWRRDDEELDAALLRVHCYDPKKRPGALAPAYLRVRTDAWEGGAFPNVPRRDDLRRRAVFSGKTTPVGETERLFDITVEAGVTREENWPGASGMPVFCGDSIIGIVKAVPTGFKGERLEVVPHWRLLEDEAFLRELRRACRVDHRGDSLAAVRQQLEANPRLVLALAQALPLSAGESRSVDAVLQRLEGFDEPRAVELLVAARKCLANERKGSAAPSQFLDFAMAFLPFVADPAIGNRLQALEDKKAEFVELPLFHETPLEIAMAAADGQPASLRPCAAWGHFPAGLYNVQPRPIEHGDVEHDDDAEAVFAELASRVGLTLTGDLTKWQPEQQDELMARRLEAFESDTRRRFYLARRLHGDRSNEDDLRDFAGELRKRLKSLPLVALHDSFENLSRDEETYLKFCGMLPTKAGKRVR